jgi:hypothetical protein
MRQTNTNLLITFNLLINFFGHILCDLLVNEFFPFMQPEISLLRFQGL